MSEGKHHPAEFPPGTCTNTAPPTTTTPLPFSGSSRTPHPHGGKPKDGKPAPGAVTGRDPPQTEPCGGPRTAPAFQPFVCRAVRTFPRDRHGNACNKRSHRPALCPGPRSPSAQHPHLSGRTSCGQRRGGARPPSLPPSLPPPAGPARPAGKGGRRSAATDGEGQAGSPVSTWHCPPGSSRHPAVSSGKEVSTIHRLLLTNY